MKRFYKNMTPELADQVRDLYFSRQFKQTELAAMYNIRQGSVSRIIAGKVWL